MKAFFSFIISVILYLVVGLVAWNVVCSMILDVDNMTLVELSDYRLCCYSGISLLISYITIKIVGGEMEDGFIVFFLGVYVINLVFAIVTNHWEGAWANVLTILTFIYNIVNIGMQSLFMNVALKEKI